MSDERREFPRVDESTAVRCTPVDDNKIDQFKGEGFTVNISGGGVRFQNSEPIDPGTQVALNLKLPQFPSAVIALAQVVWCVPSEGSLPWELGAEFHWIGWDSNAAQQQIADYIRGKLDE